MKIRKVRQSDLGEEERVKAEESCAWIAGGKSLGSRLRGYTKARICTNTAQQTEKASWEMSCDRITRGAAETEVSYTRGL